LGNHGNFDMPAHPDAVRVALGSEEHHTMTHAISEDGRERNMTPFSEASAPLLAARDLTVTYRTGPEPVVAIAGADVEIARRERVALVGESGSGKSTLGLALAGLLAGPQAEVTASTLTFAGKPLVARRGAALPARTPGIAMVFQDAMTSLDPVWTIGSQLTAVLRATEKISRRTAREHAREWLARVGLNDTERVMHARPYELSGGMRQRAMIVIALASKPSLLIADEPTSALDASLSRRTLELLVGLAGQSGTALLIISHDIGLCQEFTERTLVAYQGRLVDEGPSERLSEVAAHPYTLGLLRCVPTLDYADMDELPTLESVYEPLAANDGATGANARPAQLSVSP
jgi:peptide/nickel transport system ATP-binding protein